VTALASFATRTRETGYAFSSLDFLHQSSLFSTFSARASVSSSRSPHSRVFLPLSSKTPFLATISCGVEAICNCWCKIYLFIVENPFFSNMISSALVFRGRRFGCFLEDEGCCDACRQEKEVLGWKRISSDRITMNEPSILLMIYLCEVKLFGVVSYSALILRSKGYVCCAMWNFRTTGILECSAISIPPSRTPTRIMDKSLSM
jgi:hypothetical protein